MKLGQINRYTALGETIYNLAKRNDVNIIVEIGTWNGMGSTKCIKDAILESNKKNYNVFSLECNKKMYDEAINNNPPMPNFNIIYGSIITTEEFIDFNKIEDEYFTIYPRNMQINWFNEDIENCKNAPNVLSLLPDKIDLLILDGGEFSTFGEYNKLKNRYKYLILDDTTLLKTKNIRKQILNDNDHIVIADDLNDRNGYFVCRKI